MKRCGCLMNDFEFLRWPDRGGVCKGTGVRLREYRAFGIWGQNVGLGEQWR
jgi:hypothetical protein